MDYIIGISTTIIYLYFVFLNVFFLLKQQGSILDYFSDKYPLFMTRNKGNLESFYLYLTIPISFGLPLLFTVLFNLI